MTLIMKEMKDVEIEMAKDVERVIDVASFASIEWRRTGSQVWRETTEAAFLWNRKFWRK